MCFHFLGTWTAATNTTTSSSSSSSSSSSLSSSSSSSLSSSTSSPTSPGTTWISESDSDDSSSSSSMGFYMRILQAGSLINGFLAFLVSASESSIRSVVCIKDGVDATQMQDRKMAVTPCQGCNYSCLLLSPPHDHSAKLFAIGCNDSESLH